MKASKYLVTVDTGYRTQPHVAPAPCGAEIELHPDVAADGVRMGWLQPVHAPSDIESPRPRATGRKGHELESGASDAPTTTE